MAGKGSDRRARSQYCTAEEFNNRWCTTTGENFFKSRLKGIKDG